MSQTLASTCAKCFHQKENHQGVCNGSLECMCTKYEPPYMYEFAHRVEQEKHTRKDVYRRCEFILREIPATRNAGEKSFAKIYREIWYGFKIRKDGTKITTEEWERMPHDDTINRAKRKVKQDKPELATYDKEVLWHQTAIFQALLEMSVE